MLGLYQPSANQAMLLQRIAELVSGSVDRGVRSPRLGDHRAMRSLSEEQRPLAVGALDRIGCHERVARAVTNVAFRWIKLMSFIAGLQPLCVDELAGKELGEEAEHLTG